MMTDILLEKKWGNDDDPEMQPSHLNYSVNKNVVNQKGGFKSYPCIAFRNSCGIFHIAILVLTTILLVGLVAAIIANNVTLSTLQESNKTATPGESNYTQLKVGLIKRDLVVDSASDLKELTAEQDTIIIQSLNEDYTESYSFTINENLNVKNLKINGPITIQWLRFLFRKFHTITSLDIDSDGLCSVNMKDLNGFTFKSVDHFGLRNLFHCNDISWINKYHFPRIKSLEISNADLTEKNFKSIHMFLDEHRKTVSRISINKCFICKNCDFLDITYENKLSLQILGSKETPKSKF